MLHLHWQDTERAEYGHKMPASAAEDRFPTIGGIYGDGGVFAVSRCRRRRKPHVDATKHRDKLNDAVFLKNSKLWPPRIYMQLLDHCILKTCSEQYGLPRDSYVRRLHRVRCTV